MDQLKEIEAIKELKARYFRLLDAKDWTALGNCLTEDVVFTYLPQQINISGKIALVENFSTRESKTKYVSNLFYLRLIEEGILKSQIIYPLGWIIDPIKRTFCENIIVFLKPT